MHDITPITFYLTDNLFLIIDFIKLYPNFKSSLLKFIFLINILRCYNDPNKSVQSLMIQLTNQRTNFSHILNLKQDKNIQIEILVY